RPVTMRERQFRKQARDPPVDHAMPLATGLLAQGAAKKRLADAGRAGDEDVLMLGDPPTGRQLSDHGAIEFPATVVEIFEARVAQSEFGLLEPARQGAIVAGELLGVDDHTHA